MLAFILPIIFLIVLVAWLGTDSEAGVHRQPTQNAVHRAYRVVRYLYAVVRGIDAAVQRYYLDMQEVEIKLLSDEVRKPKPRMTLSPEEMQFIEHRRLPRYDEPGSEERTEESWRSRILGKLGLSWYRREAAKQEGV